MGLFGGNKNGSTEDERYQVLSLAKDEDWTLYEFTNRLTGDTDRTKLTVAELLSKGMLEMFVVRPDRERTTLSGPQADEVLARPQNWQKPEEGQDRYFLTVTDKGWRWHAKHWKPHN